MIQDLVNQELSSHVLMLVHRFSQVMGYPSGFLSGHLGYIRQRLIKGLQKYTLRKDGKEQFVKVRQN